MDVQIIIAILLAYIAWQNYRINEAGFYINKDKLRLDLFDRRYKIFEAFRALFLDFAINAKVDSTKLSEFIINTTDTEFLFGNEVTLYREEVKDNLFRLRTIHGRLERGVPEDVERGKLAEEAEKLEEWLVSQNDHIKKLFKKYLRFAINARHN